MKIDPSEKFKFEIRRNTKSDKPSEFEGILFLSQKGPK